MIRQWLFLKNFHKTWSNETMDRFLVFILFLFFSSFALLPSQFSFLFSLFSHNFSWLNRENSYGGFVYCSANEDLSFSYVPSPSCLCDSSCLLIILFDTFPFSLRLECHFQEEEKDTDDVRAWPCVCVTVCMIEFLFSSRLFCLLLSLSFSLSFFPFLFLLLLPSDFFRPWLKSFFFVDVVIVVVNVLLVLLLISFFIISSQTVDRVRQNKHHFSFCFLAVSLCMYVSESERLKLRNLWLYESVRR